MTPEPISQEKTIEKISALFLQQEVELTEVKKRHNKEANKILMAWAESVRKIKAGTYFKTTVKNGRKKAGFDVWMVGKALAATYGNGSKVDFLDVVYQCKLIAGPSMQSEAVLKMGENANPGKTISESMVLSYLNQAKP